MNVNSAIGVPLLIKDLSASASHACHVTEKKLRDRTISDVLYITYNLCMFPRICLVCINVYQLNIANILIIL